MIELKSTLDLKAKSVQEIFRNTVNNAATDDEFMDYDDYNSPIEEMRALDIADENDSEGEEPKPKPKPKPRYTKSVSKNSQKEPKKTFPLTKDRRTIRFFHPMAGLLPPKVCCNVFRDTATHTGPGSDGFASDNVRCSFPFRSNIRRLQHYTPSLR